MNAKDAILYLYDKGLLNIDAIIKNKDSIMQELDNTTEILTKHDPCRLFKKGDKVRVVEWNGRKPEAEDKLYTVQQNERPGSTMVDIGPNDAGGSSFYTVCFLELVTPVEELARYSVELLQDGLPPDTYHFWAVKDNMGHEVARFWCEQYKNGEAEALAEAERDRLNAEWRKEQNQCLSTEK